MDMMQMVMQLLNKIKNFFKRKEWIRMVDMYLALVIAGRRTCDKNNKTVRLVPTRYLNAVLAELEALGLDANGNPVE
jgi:hypothetical protein